MDLLHLVCKFVKVNLTVIVRMVLPEYIHPLTAGISRHSRPNFVLKFSPKISPSPTKLHSAIPSGFATEEQARLAYSRLCWLLMMTMIGSATAAPGVSIAMSAAKPISHRRNKIDFSMSHLPTKQ